MDKLWKTLASLAIGGLIIETGRQLLTDRKESKLKIAILGQNLQLSHSQQGIIKEEIINPEKSSIQNYDALWVAKSKLNSKTELNTIKKYLASEKVVLFINTDILNPVLNITNKSNHISRLATYFWQDNKQNINSGIIKGTNDTQPDIISQLLIEKTINPI